MMPSRSGQTTKQVNLEGFTTDNALEILLKKKAKAKLASILAVIAAGFGLGALGFLEERYGLPEIFFDLYLYAWVTCFVGLFVFVPPWVPPRCTRCGNRTEKCLRDERGGQQRIYFICVGCKWKADTGISVGGD